MKTIRAKLRTDAEIKAGKYLEKHPELSSVDYEFEIDDVSGE